MIFYWLTDWLTDQPTDWQPSYSDGFLCKSPLNIHRIKFMVPQYTRIA